MERPQPRTLLALERLTQESDRTLEELREDFERCARENKEKAATISVRQPSRWMAGRVNPALCSPTQAVASDTCMPPIVILALHGFVSTFCRTDARTSG